MGTLTLLLVELPSLLLLPRQALYSTPLHSTPSAKMSGSRRNVHYYDTQTDTQLGGVFQSGSITNANFFHMLSHVLLDFEGNITIRSRTTDQLMPLNNDRLETGDYNISSSSGESIKEIGSYGNSGLFCTLC
jgi:hypothetical protein